MGKGTRFGKLCIIGFAIALSLSFIGADCNGSDGGGGGGGGGGNFTIQMNGGQGTEYYGGDGGFLYMESYGIKGINILRGKRPIKTSFAMPKEAVQDLGDDPVIITTDTTVDVYVDQPTAQGAVSNGDLYMYVGSYYLWVRDSVGGDYTATGLKVNQGRTLTLGLNYNYAGGQTGQDTAYIRFDNSVVIAGTLTTKSLDTGDVSGLVIENRHAAPATAKDRGGLYLYSYLSIWVTGTGKIDVSGADAAAASGERGGDGARFDLYSSDGAIYMHGKIDASGGDGDGVGIGGDAGAYGSGFGTSYLESSEGVIVTTGMVDISGGTGSDGGDSYDFYIESEYNWWNTGRIMANGGDGTDGDGGDGGYLYFEAYYGSIYFRGLAQSNGGDAVDGDGGDGDYIDFEPGYDDYMGEMSVAGRLEAMGGNATESVPGVSGGGDGGYGGEVEYYMYGSGELRSTATILIDGGDAAGASNSGGYGGELYIQKYVGYDEVWSGDDNNPMDALITGRISLNGGDGEYGGDGGYIYAYQDDDNVEMNEPDYGIFFVNYASVQANGGDGETDGGDGGYFDAYTYDSWTDYLYAYWQTGPIIFKSNFLAHGGNGRTGYGGDGYEYYLYTDYDTTDGNCVFHHVGTIDLSGGDGALGGGDAGYVYAYAIDEARIDGTVNLSGGNGTAGNANGGDGDYMELYASYDVVMNANINARGGKASGTGTGGEGGNWFYFEAGAQTVINGNIDARGGDGDAASGFGGDGGYFWITSEWTGSRVNGSILLDGGNANTDGTAGELYVDGTFMYGDY